MELKNAVNYVVAMVTFVAVVSLSYLQSMFLPAHMKETMLCCFYRFVECYIAYTITLCIINQCILNLKKKKNKALAILHISK